MKKILSTFLLCISLCAYCFMFSACNLFGNALNAPNIQICGNVIYWDEIESADSYQIFIGENSTTVTSNYYVIKDTESIQEAYVIARRDEKQSKKSNKVAVPKTTYSDDEVVKINFQSDRGFSIPANSSFVSISGSATNSTIQIENRTRDLVIELDNVSLTSSEGKSCIATIDGNYDSTKLNYTVTFIVKGTNTLIGSNYTSVPSKPKNNSKTRGTTGGAGGSGIVLPKVVFTGNGSLTLQGGNGGKGGEGSDSTTWSTNSNAPGGNGGTGGSGIKSTTILLAMNVEGIIKTYAGNDGTGGKAGVNGSILTGPWVDIGGGNPNGSKGATGEKYIGTLLKFGGTID